MPQEVFLKILEGISDDGGADYSLDDPFGSSISTIARIGIGMDSSITLLRHGGLSLVQTTDFFYTFVDGCEIEAGTNVTGGQMVINPWCTIGGVATKVCQLKELIISDFAMAGDVLVMTKPLGTQVALNAH